MATAYESFITPVPSVEFDLLHPLTVPVLAEQLETVRTELADFEEWLGTPPEDATEHEIQEKLSLWDTCRQWFFAYEQALSDMRQEVAYLDESLAETRGLIRGLEVLVRLCHDEEAARDVYLRELEEKESRILGRLEALGAPLPSEEKPPVPSPPSAEPHLAARSSIQRALDEEWAHANFSGPGCPFCDSLFGACGCWERRREAHEAEERRQVREDRAAIARAIADGKCYCDQLSQEDPDGYAECCEICQREEELRCRECGQLECRPGCCGGCGGCERCRGPECKRCGSWDCCCYEDDRDGASSCGCGACEEHRSWGEGGW